MSRIQCPKAMGKGGLAPSWRQTFNTPKEVVDGGGVLSGTLTINNGLSNGNTFDTGGIRFIGKGPVGKYTKFSIRAHLKTGDCVTINETPLFCVTVKQPGTVNTIELYHYFDYIELQIANSGYTSYIQITPNTEYDMIWVWDGSLAAGSRVSCYNNGVLQALAWNAAPTDVTVYQPTIGVFADPLTANNYCDKNITLYELAFYDTALTAEEVADIYQGDTYNEVNPENSLLCLPLQSWYYGPNGIQLVADGDMEAVGVGSWTVANNALLTKQTLNPVTGLQWLKVEYTDTPSPQARQLGLFTIGYTYRATGYVCGDGAATTGIIYLGSTKLFESTTSTAWQWFDVTVVCAGGTGMALNAATAAAGYAGFDDIRIELVVAQTKNIGTGGNAIMGDGITVATFPTFLGPHSILGDGVNKYANTGLVDPFSTPFTVGAVWRSPVRNSSYQNLLCTYDNWNGDGFELIVYPARLECYMCDPLYNWMVKSFKLGGPLSGLVSHFVTYDGSGVTSGILGYQNGQAMEMNSQLGTLGAHYPNNGKSLLVGADWTTTSVTNKFNCIIAYPVFFAFALSPGQVQWLHNRLMSQLNSSY